MPESVQRIGEDAFYGVTINKLKLPARQPDMGDGVSSACYCMSELVIPEAWASLPNKMCDHWTRLTSVSLPAGLKEIDDLAFSYCKALTSITFPAGLEHIG